MGEGERRRVYIYRESERDRVSEREPDVNYGRTEWFAFKGGYCFFSFLFFFIFLYFLGEGRVYCS